MSRAPEDKGPQTRFEWISLVYLFFFVLAVMSPEIVKRARLGRFNVPEEQIEEVLIFLFGLAGIAVFAGYNRVMERRMRERDEAILDAERAKRELIDSYKYIGSMNRRIDLLKKLTNETSVSILEANAPWKDLLQSLAANAAASVNASRVLLRTVDLARLRTEREVEHAISDSRPFRIPNKDLAGMHADGSAHAYLKTEDGERVLAVPSDRKDSATRAFLLLSVDPSEITDVEISLVKVFANQAELVCHQLARKGGQEALEKIEEVTGLVVGEVR